MASSCSSSIIIFLFLCSISTVISSDVATLLGKIKPALSTSTNLELSSWNSSLPLCKWRGLQWAFSNGSLLSCAQSPSLLSNLSLYKDPSLQLVSIHLPASALSGSIPKEIGELSSLQSLLLGVNNLTGVIPLELGNCPELAELDLGGNFFDGSIPVSIWNLCGKLQTLSFHGNKLSGSVPEPAVPNPSCTNLKALDLADNQLEGEFPLFVTRFSGLQELDLSSNRLSGSIPDSILKLNNLQRLNLSYNNFSGVVPPLSKFGAESLQGNNPSLCGSPLKQCGSNSRLSSGAIAGIIIGLMVGVVVLASVLIGWYQGRKRKNVSKRIEEDEMEIEEGDGGEGKLMVFQGGEHLTLEDVLNATGQVLEKTSYGTVYKAKLNDGGTIALRLLREGSSMDLASCLPVVRYLGRARHENVVPLRAFYQGKRGEKLLIYDYLHNRSLHDLLHESRAGRPMLNWPRRHKIALGIARGLAYLHTGQENPITHGNIRSKNVLVDEFFVSRVTEYGLDKIMVPSVADEMITISKLDGYKAPELQKMKKCNSRTDVYSFGILLLEILMGKKPGKGNEGSDLPALVKVAVLEETTMEVFDDELLRGIRSPTEDGLVQALKLAMGCCAPTPEVRPDMREIVKQLEENRPRNRSALYSPTDRSEIGTPF
ncbi:uncharacterized protein A4U43_C01F7150 [Asparagus officinalis]|uniref:Protein kinase domain-containing protein n=1 Tax=Asparagus officinalis TaxID=4686 RepID=A0A5P1FMI9_ASPOF|nr:putative kinase-like protein TMKL1 [Asparagus officinalis]ONK79516.1 uncharacterized protein A4U43_C01F7150 [Asparagus officinalis]